MPRSGWKKKVIACDFDAARVSLPDEQWLPAVGWERFYRVSSLGRVYSLHQTGRLVTGMRVRGGYRVLKVRDGERQANLMVHRMVLEAFCGPRPDGQEVRHRNGIPDDNRADNLCWGTKTENQADRITHGTSNHGAACNFAKLSDDVVRQLRLTPEVTDQEWSVRLGLHVNTIQHARYGETWKLLDVPPMRAKCVSDNKSIEAAMQLAGHTNMSMTRRVYDRGVREVDPLE